MDEALESAAPSTDALDPRPVRLEDMCQAARAEVAGFLAIVDGAAFVSPSCAALLRAWHTLASLDALLRGAAVSGAAMFLAQLRAEGSAALGAALAETTNDFARSVLDGATADPWAPCIRPTDKELRRHRRLLLRALARLDRQARRRIPFPWRRWLRAAGASIAAIAVVACGAFIFFRPRWRVAYFANDRLAGTPVLVERVPTADQNWGLSGPGPGIPADGFSARFESCLRLSAAADVEITVASDDGSRVFVDDRGMLSFWSDHGFEPHSESVRLAAGVHRVRLEYYERSGSASVSFKARIPATNRDLAGSLGLPANESGGCAP